MSASPKAGRAAVILLAVAALGLSGIVWRRPDFLLNADTLLPAEFAWDVAHHSYAWTSFQQARVPSFFPDLLFFLAAQAAGLAWRASYALWVVLAAGWLLGIGGFLTARLARIEFRDGAIPFAAIGIALVLAGLSGFPWVIAGRGFFEPFAAIVLPFDHGGPFLLALTVAALARPGARSSSVYGIVLVFLLAAAAMLSDFLGLLSLFVPFTAACAAGLWRGTIARPAAARSLAALWSGGAVGAALSEAVYRQTVPNPTFGVVRFFGDIVFEPGMLLTGVVFVLLVVEGLRRSVTWKKAAEDFWFVFAFVASVGSLAGAILFYGNIWTLRYAMPFLWWSVMLAAAFVARRPAWRERIATVAVCGTAALCIAAALPARRQTVFTWAPPLESCLEKAGYKAGLANYWNARAINAASDWRLQAGQILADGSAYVWGNDRLWFTHDIHDDARPPAFRFIVMDGLDPRKIMSVYGEPNWMTDCNGSAVWLYDDSAHVLKALLGASLHGKHSLGPQPHSP